MEFNLNAVMARAMKTYTESVVQETTKYLSEEYGFSTAEALKKVLGEIKITKAEPKPKEKAPRKKKEVVTARQVIAGEGETVVESEEPPKKEKKARVTKAKAAARPVGFDSSAVTT